WIHSPRVGGPMLPRLLLAFTFTGVLLAPAQTAAPPSLTPAEAETLEATSDSAPNDLDVRVRLLRYYLRAGTSDAARVRPLRRKHIVWLVEHRPTAAILGEAAGTIERTGQALADPDGYAAAEAAWRKHFAGDAPGAAVFANAIAFL